VGAAAGGGAGASPRGGQEACLAPLVRRAQRGDGAALGALLEQVRPALLRFCRRLVPEEATAQDLAQEALLRAHGALPRLTAPGRFEAWLCGIAANLARSWWRRQARAPVSLEGLAPDAAAREPALRVLHSPEEAAVEAEGVRRVRAAVEALPPALGRAVALFYLEGLSYAEVAAAQAVPVSTVKSRLFESRARLRLVLAPVDPGCAGARREEDAVPPVPASSALPAEPEVPAVAATPFVRLRVEIDREGLVGACHALVTDPRPDRIARHRPLLRGAPVPFDLLEVMVLEGVTRRRDVAALVGGLLDGATFSYRWDFTGEAGRAAVRARAPDRPATRRSVSRGARRRSHRTGASSCAADLEAEAVCGAARARHSPLRARSSR
jgi:RNA polymerase sigma-70 factor, ECF subfamily